MTCLDLKVSPKASRNAVVRWMGQVLKVSVTAVPERGKANAAVEALLAEALSLPRGAVRVIAGETSSSKRVEIAGLALPEIQNRLRARTG